MRAFYNHGGSPRSHSSRVSPDFTTPISYLDEVKDRPKQLTKTQKKLKEFEELDKAKAEELKDKKEAKEAKKAEVKTPTPSPIVVPSEYRARRRALKEYNRMKAEEKNEEVLEQIAEEVPENEPDYKTNKSCVIN